MQEKEQELEAARRMNQTHQHSTVATPNLQADNKVLAQAHLKINRLEAQRKQDSVKIAELQTSCNAALETAKVCQGTCSAVVMVYAHARVKRGT